MKHCNRGGGRGTKRHSSSISGHVPQGRNNMKGYVVVNRSTVNNVANNMNNLVKSLSSLSVKKTVKKSKRKKGSPLRLSSEQQKSARQLRAVRRGLEKHARDARNALYSISRSSSSRNATMRRPSTVSRRPKTKRKKKKSKRGKKSSKKDPFVFTNMKKALNNLM